MLNKCELLLTLFPGKVDPNLWENEQSGHQGTGVSNSITSSKTSKVLFITPLPSIVSRWGNLDDKWGSQSNRSGKGLKSCSVCVSRCQRAAAWQPPLQEDSPRRRPAVNVLSRGRAQAQWGRGGLLRMLITREGQLFRQRM